VIVGKESAIELAVTCLLARGHLLFEDLPGVGKTTLRRHRGSGAGIAVPPRAVHQRSAASRHPGRRRFLTAETSSFLFKPGPVFAQVLLADEINRATPKTQSAAAAGGDGGRTGHGGWNESSAARAILCHRHAESDHSDGHVFTSRIAARPLFDALGTRRARP